MVNNVLEDAASYVKIISVMGDEFTTAEDARMSTNKGRLGPDKDARLQERLMKDKHTSPFEGTIIKFELCLPLFVLREIDRHRTLDKLTDEELCFPEENSRKWFARNEMSGRYVKMPNEYYIPRHVRKQSSKNNQSTSSDVEFVSNDIQQQFIERGAEVVRSARELYEWACDNGIERGLARIFNTQNQYTKIRMTGSLKNWLDFCALRCKPDVLWECRVYADAIKLQLQELFPSVVEQWEQLVMQSVTLTKNQFEELVKLLQTRTLDYPLSDKINQDIYSFLSQFEMKV
jgi:thymidylate synthase (FAD)